MSARAAQDAAVAAHVAKLEAEAAEAAREMSRSSLASVAAVGRFHVALSPAFTAFLNAEIERGTDAAEIMAAVAFGCATHLAGFIAVCAPGEEADVAGDVLEMMRETIDERLAAVASLRAGGRP
ncbi:MAG: hypothetical protein NW215_10550 [Hyphomicrobiales bacterium]|nr:hypothetical protein [Hyphomicrobiales bacterium]